MTDERKGAAEPSRADPLRAVKPAQLAVRVREFQVVPARVDSIECAKRILMDRHGLEAQPAFELLRRTARRSSQTIAAVAQRVINARSGSAARPSATGNYALTPRPSETTSATLRAALAWGAPERELRPRKTS